MQVINSPAESWQHPWYAALTSNEHNWSLACVFLKHSQIALRIVIWDPARSIAPWCISVGLENSLSHDELNFDQGCTVVRVTREYAGRLSRGWTSRIYTRPRWTPRGTQTRKWWPGLCPWPCMFWETTCMRIERGIILVGFRQIPSCGWSSLPSLGLDGHYYFCLWRMLFAGRGPEPLDVFTITRPSGASLTRIGRGLSSSHGVVRSRRVTGFWNRPLAGLFGPNVSWKLRDMVLSASASCRWPNWMSDMVMICDRAPVQKSVPRPGKNLWNAPEGWEAYLNRHWLLNILYTYIEWTLEVRALRPWTSSKRNMKPVVPLESRSSLNHLGWKL